MPLYEYECDACGHRFEVIQKFSDAPITSCRECSGPVQKLLSSPAIQFKGSGFYLTDYGRGTGKKSESTGSKAATSDSGGAASGSESGKADTTDKAEKAGKTDSATSSTTSSDGGKETKAKTPAAKAD